MVPRALGARTTPRAGRVWHFECTTAGMPDTQNKDDAKPTDDEEEVNESDLEEVDDDDDDDAADKTRTPMADAAPPADRDAAHTKDTQPGIGD